MKNLVIIFGPGPQFKGGLANYTLSLAKAMDKLGMETHIFSWTQQYPAIIPRDFIDRSTRSDKLKGTNIKVHYLTNYNNPLSWKKTVNEILRLAPSKIIFQWSIAVQGVPMGYIAKRLKQKAKNTEVIFDLHFVIQKEESKLDRLFTHYGLKHAHSYVAHAYKTVDELKSLFPDRDYTVNESGERETGKGEYPVIKLYHPVYDMFRPDPEFDIEKVKKELHLKKHVFLFFGFIRKYKGLHHCIDAFAKLRKKRDDISLLIVGESFWDTLNEKKLLTRIKKILFGVAKKLFMQKKGDEENYRPLEMISKYGIEDDVAVVNRYVSDEEVPKYFQVSNAILLFYEYATPSGVESMAYNFKLPILATRVGHFPETVKDGENGYLADPDSTEDMAEAMNKAIKNPIDPVNVEKTAREMSWEYYAKALLRSS